MTQQRFKVIWGVLHPYYRNFNRIACWTRTMAWGHSFSWQLYHASGIGTMAGFDWDGWESSGCPREPATQT